MPGFPRLLLGALLAAGSAACASGLRPLAPATAPNSDGRSDASIRPPAAAGPIRRSAAPADASRVALGALAGGTLDTREYEADARVARYVALFSGSARESFAAQLDRGTRYEAMIRARLRSAGLPEELFYLALVESGFEPQATSRVSAVGMWQFMAGTARELGLRVDWWVDERRDPIRATDAAARNLRWLRSQFGSMLLAVAAYNGGPTRVARGLVRLAADDSLRADAVRLALAGTDSSLDAEASAIGDAARPGAVGDARYFALSNAGYLRPETVNYVPQLIAALMIARDPARHGIAVRPQSRYEYDSVRVGPLTPLAAVASAASATRDEILDLNPHLLRGMTPPDAPSLVRVPVGRAAVTASALADVSAAERRAFHEVRTGKRETLAAVAERESVPVRLLQRYNPAPATIDHGTWKGRLVAGQALRVPSRPVLAFTRDVADADTARLTGLPALSFLPQRADVPTTPKSLRPAKAAGPKAVRAPADRKPAASRTRSDKSPRAAAPVHRAAPKGGR